MTTLLERSVLATVISCDMLQDEERKQIEQTELYEEWFTAHSFKIIVKIINALKIKNKPYTMEMIVFHGRKNGLDLEDEIINIMTNNGFGSYNTFMSYLAELKDKAKDKQRDLI